MTDVRNGKHHGRGLQECYGHTSLHACCARLLFFVKSLKKKQKLTIQVLTVIFCFISFTSKCWICVKNTHLSPFHRQWGPVHTGITQEHVPRCCAVPACSCVLRFCIPFIWMGCIIHQNVKKSSAYTTFKNMLHQIAWFMQLGTRKQTAFAICIWGAVNITLAPTCTSQRRCIWSSLPALCSGVKCRSSPINPDKY